MFISLELTGMEFNDSFLLRLIRPCNIWCIWVLIDGIIHLKWVNNKLKNCLINFQVWIAAVLIISIASYWLGRIGMWGGGTGFRA